MPSSQAQHARTHDTHILSRVAHTNTSWRMVSQRRRVQWTVAGCRMQHQAVANKRDYLLPPRHCMNMHEQRMSSSAAVNSSLLLSSRPSLALATRCCRRHSGGQGFRLVSRLPFVPHHQTSPNSIRPLLLLFRFVSYGVQQRRATQPPST